MRKRTLLPALTVVTVMATGCDSGALAPDHSRLSAEDAQLLAARFDALGSALIDGALGGLGVFFSAGSADGTRATTAAVPVNVTFTRTHECPKEGQVTVTGTITGERDRTTRTLTTEANSTKTHSNCAFETRNGVTITVNGNPNVAIKANRKIVDGAPSGLQTMSQKGSFSYSTSDGRSGVCEIDITSTFDPATKTLTIKGTNCGRTVEIIRTRGN